MSKILVIEDETLTRDMLRDCLENEGFQTLGAENGLAGIQQVRQHLPSLVLCDIIMPKLDGYEVLNQLRQNVTTATIPFVFLTAKTQKVDRRQGMSLGADDFLTKPSTAEELLEVVSARLEKQAILQKLYAGKYETSNYEREDQPPNISVSPRDGDYPPGTLGDRKTNLLFPSGSELDRVFEFIEANYNKGITLCDVAKAVGYSPAYLTNKVKQETGRTVNRWIIERRMAEALVLLRSTDCSVEHIAMTIGYQNTCHFFRQFRQYQGTTPQAWRKKQ